MEIEPAVIAHPDGVDVVILPRGLAVNDVFPAADEGIAAGGATGADALGLLEEPDAHLEAEIGRGQRADGADIDGVERVIAIERAVRMAGDGRYGCRDPTKPSTSSCATSFMKRMQREQRTQRSASRVTRGPTSTFFGFLTLCSRKREPPLPYSTRELLELALAGLVADGAIERMIDEQKLHHALAAFLDHRGIGADAHALGDVLGAGNLRARNPADLRLAIRPDDGLRSGPIFGMPISMRHMRQLPGEESFG